LVTAFVSATARLAAFPVPITLSCVLLSAEVALIVAPPTLIAGAVALFTAIIIVLERLA
jgi:hypothetical protein